MREADARLAAGDARPLEGLALAVKDMFCTRDVRTTACSHILDNFCRPGVDRDRAALARRCGAARQDQQRQFAMGSSNESSFFGAVTSPWRRRRQHAAGAGGSSAARQRR
jgi:aspartyl-tRNA(Asn)/glutamyl-tRNA(Gln) amidotransferase subunit A